MRPGTTTATTSTRSGATCTRPPRPCGPPPSRFSRTPTGAGRRDSSGSAPRERRRLRGGSARQPPGPGSCSAHAQGSPSARSPRGLRAPTQRRSRVTGRAVGPRRWCIGASAGMRASRRAARGRSPGTTSSRRGPAQLGSRFATRKRAWPGAAALALGARPLRSSGALGALAILGTGQWQSDTDENRIALGATCVIGGFRPTSAATPHPKLVNASFQLTRAASDPLSHDLLEEATEDFGFLIAMEDGGLPAHSGAGPRRRGRARLITRLLCQRRPGLSGGGGGRRREGSFRAGGRGTRRRRGGGRADRR
jgi:hypothetical protein